MDDSYYLEPLAKVLKGLFNLTSFELFLMDCVHVTSSGYEEVVESCLKSLKKLKEINFCLSKFSD